MVRRMLDLPMPGSPARRGAWSSPPCPTHSRFWGQNRTPEYPDMKLYQEILFLAIEALRHDEAVFCRIAGASDAAIAGTRSQATAVSSVSTA